MSVKLDDSVCRVCLSSSGSITIFDDCGKDDQFRYCTSLEAAKDDGLPSKLCKKCNDHLKVAYDFRFQAIYAEKYFRKTIFLPMFKKEVDDGASNNVYELDTKSNNCSGELDENMAEIDMLLAIHTEGVENVDDNTDDDTDDKMMDNSEFYNNDSIDIDEKQTEIIGMETFEKEKREQKDQKIKLEIANVPPPLVSTTEGHTRYEVSSVSLASKPVESPQSAISNSNTSVPQTVSINEVQQYTDAGCFLHHTQSVQDIPVQNNDGIISQHIGIHPILKNDPTGYDFNAPAVGFNSYVTPSQIQFQQMPLQTEYEQSHNTLSLQEPTPNSGSFDFAYQEPFATFQTQTNDIIAPQQQDPNIQQFQQTQGPEIPNANSCKTEYQTTVVQKQKKQKNTSTRTSKDRIECNICGSIFTHLNSLKTHLLKHSGEKPFNCEFCDKAFARKTVLNIHRRLHTGEKPYKCSLCSSAYVTKEALASHLIKHSGVKPFNCEFCDKAFVRKRVLNIHKRSHTGEKPHKCSLCSNAYAKKEALARHLQKDHEQEVGVHFRRDKVSYICSICNKSRCSKYSLASHMKTHFNEAKVRRKIIRRKKEKKLDSQDGLSSNELMAQHNVLLKYSCKICHNCFPNKWELCTHAESHNMNKTFECDVCQRTFEKKFQLLYHLQTHEGGEELVKAKVKPSVGQKKPSKVKEEKIEDQSQSTEKKPRKKLCVSKRRKKKTKIESDQEEEKGDDNEQKEEEDSKRDKDCQETSEDDDNAERTSRKKRATRAQRENLKVLRTSSKIECLICEAAFTHPTSLKTHMLVHSGERPFKCDYCDKSFARKTVLNIHRRLHTGEKPYKCPLCDSACVTKDALMRHMSKDHDDDRDADRIKFTCGVCHKAMGTKYSLQTHMKLHEQNTTESSAELNFSCNMCTESFDKKSDYAKHMEVHDSHRNFQCDICQVTFEKKFKLLFHLQTHKIEDLPCKKCGETFTIRENLMQHVKAQHIDPQNMDFQCPTCNIAQYDNRDLKLHMLNVHEVAMGELNSCDLCGESHSTAAAYYKHMHEKHDTISKTCIECKKYFDSRKAFDKHILTHYM